MARREGIKFLGSLPVDTELVTLLDAAAEEPSASAAPSTENGSGDSGDNDQETFLLWQRYRQTPTAPLFSQMAADIVRQLTLTREGTSDS